jgi:ABC-type hemin transport system substrate-binding protein
MKTGFFLMALTTAAIFFPRSAQSVRLIATSPQTTELIFELGKEGDLVAASSESRFPPQAAELPTIGPLFAPGLETIVRYRPHWVIIDEYLIPGSMTASLNRHTRSVLSLRLDSPAALVAESRRLLSTIYAVSSVPKLKELERLVAGLKENQRPFRFLAFTWFTPPIVFGHGSFFSNLMADLGGQNAIPLSLDHPYPEISPDWFAMRPVDVIYVLGISEVEKSETEKFLGRWWGARRPKLIYLDPNVFGRASAVAIRNAKLLHPFATHEG